MNYLYAIKEKDFMKRNFNEWLKLSNQAFAITVIMSILKKFMAISKI